MEKLVKKFNVEASVARDVLEFAGFDYAKAKKELESKKFVSSVRLYQIGRRSSGRFWTRGSQPYKFAPFPSDHELRGGIWCRWGLPRGRLG